MPVPEHAEILRRAREAYLEHGRGFVVVVEGRKEPQYGFFDGLQKSPSDIEEATEIVKAAALRGAARAP